MACTIAVTRRGQQRSLARIFQALRVATARSPTARILAWWRLTVFCRWDSRGRYRRRLNGVRTLPPAPLVRLVGEGHDVDAGQRVDQAVGAGGGQVVHRAGQSG